MAFENAKLRNVWKLMEIIVILRRDSSEIGISEKITFVWVLVIYRRSANEIYSSLDWLIWSIIRFFILH